MKNLANKVVKKLIKKKLKVSFAESCTGGLLSSSITSISGSSKIFNLGLITYSNKAKIKLLGVEQQTLDNYGAVSEQVVEQMAGSALKSSDADYAIAVSGIAGPDGGTAEKPVGTVWICWITPEITRVEKYQLQGDRQAVRDQVIKISLQELLQQLN